MEYYQFNPLTPKKCGVDTIGMCKALWTYRRLWITIGPHWPFNICISLMYIIVIGGFSMFLSQELSGIMDIIGYGLLVFSFATYVLTALINPGIVFNDGKTELKDNHCQYCFVNNDAKVKHCDDCQVCVRDLDHHCPLSGKCIAKGNFVVFNAFLASILMVFVYVMIFAMSSSPSDKSRS